MSTKRKDPSTIGDCLVTPRQAQDFGNKDISRITGNVLRLLVRRSPYIDILDGGTFPNGVSIDQRAIIMERPVMNISLVQPAFTDDILMCGNTGTQASVGSTEYTTRLQSIRGVGPKLCVKQMRENFQESYIATQDALQKQILYIMNVDVRSTLLLRSGVKCNVSSTQPFENMVSGDAQRIDTVFRDYWYPDSPLSFKLLKYAANYMHEDLLAEPFDSDKGVVAKWIGSLQSIENMRDELGVHQDLQYLTTGRYEIGTEGVSAYAWEGPYRGLVFGIDQQPLRFNTWGPNLLPQFIEPEISVPTTIGVGARANPAYRSALYEVGFLVFANSFMRQVPDNYTGVGDMQFPTKYAQGELEFVVLRDNDCNTYGDYGYHIYQMIRAYRPERPHAVIPIMYKRCNPTFNFLTCPSYPGSASGYSM